MVIRDIDLYKDIDELLIIFNNGTRLAKTEFSMQLTLV